MKAITKIALVSASVLTTGALTACQSNPGSKEDSDRHSMMHGGEHHKMSPEQREQMKQMRAERHEFMKQAKTACENKAVGSTASFQVNGKTVDGTCTIKFRPDRDAMKASHDHAKDKADRPNFHFKHGQELTAEQKAQREQKRAERKAQWEALQSACAGQTNGKQIQVKLDDKLIPGTCSVRFKPNARPDMMKPLAATPTPPKA